MVIDAHNHPDWHGHDLSRFLANMDANGIDVTWLLSWECPPGEYDPQFHHVVPDLGALGPIPFSRCLSYAERAPDRFVLGFCPDPRRSEAISRMRAMKEIYGVRVCGELKVRMTYDNPDALRLFRFCGEQGLPVVVHIDYEVPAQNQHPWPSWWYGGGIDALERVLRACPATTFLGHAPGFWAHISADGTHDKVSYPEGPVVPGGRLVTMLRACPNLWCDTSAGSGWNALNRDRGFARQFLLEFQDRVLYGRDYFDSRHRELLASLDLPPAVLEKILCGNALRLVPLH